MKTAQETIKIVESFKPYLEHNAALIEIFEGNLLKYVDQALRCQLTEQSYAQAVHRIYPVNILPKVIDKLTNIYQTTVVREVVDGTEQDEELVEWYVDNMHLNDTMNCANEMFNLCKGTLLYPSVRNGLPFLRPIENDKFVVVGSNMDNPMEPTEVVILFGQKDGKDIYWVVDKNQFVVYTGGNVDYQEMAKLNNPNGENPYGALPYVWVPDSKYRIMPIQDSSVLKVTTTLPVIISDLNLAAMFQTFSILYGIDLDDEAIKFAPNAFWKFKSDLASDKKPEIGQIKPQVDIDQVIRLVEAELSMWLGTKGIRPGTVGQLTAENVASGISKIIDEMDTYEARQKQTVVFQKAESQLWDLILNYMHPYWVSQGLVENRHLLTPGAKVKTTFAMQLPQKSRGDVVRDLRDEVAAGFTTRALAIKRLNPEMSQEDVEALVAEIEGTDNAASRSASNDSSPEDSEDSDSVAAS